MTMPTTPPTDILDSATWKRECAAQHFGLWAVEPEWFSRAVAAVKDGTYDIKSAKAMGPESDSDGRTSYANHGGIAVIPIQGPVMKARSKFGGTSSVDTRIALRKAANDDSVRSILLHIDSPGGTVAGSFELAKEIAGINGNRKPVYAHIEDLGASAGYLFASQARRITADATSYVGSIGVVTTLEDTTGMMEKVGIKVEVISTGGMKGAGRDGKITDDMREEAQQHVDEIGDHFVAMVVGGRSMSSEKVTALADGRVHIADKAKQLGLIDEVASLDAAIASICRDGKMTIESHTTEATQEIAAEAPLQIETPEHQESQRSDTPDVQAKPEITEMADIQTNSPEQTPPSGAGSNTQGAEIAKLNQQAIESYVNRGRELGKAEGRQQEVERMRTIAAACPGREDLAVKAFMAGQNADTVKLVYDAATAAAASERQASMTKDVEIARLQALVATGGHNGVGYSASDTSSTDNAPSGLTPQEQAKFEWDSDAQIRARHGGNEKQWMLFRTNQLKGNVGILKIAS